jgi:hypothetical protein
MIFRKSIVILFALFLHSGFLCGQQLIFSTFQRVNYLIPYRISDEKILLTGNAILREMAKDVLREPWQVRLQVSGELVLKITGNGGQNHLDISLRNQFMGGDTLYRHFPVAGVLRPSLVNMKLKWANRADTSGYTEQALIAIPVEQEDSLLYSIPIAPFDTVADTLMVRDIVFSYDSLALKEFQNKVGLIHDYYASVSLLDSLQLFTSSLHLENQELLPVNFLKISELCRVIDRIDRRDFPGRLLHHGYDPSGLMAKYSRLFKQSRTLIYTFLDELHKTGAIPWDHDVARLARYFTSRVFSYVRRSYLMDQQQGLIYHDCLDHFFDNVAFPPEENVVPVLLSKMFADSGQDTVGSYVSKEIYAAYLAVAEELMLNHAYAEAFSMMENGGRFIDGNPGLKGFKADEDITSRAAEGICDSYVGIASTCIRNHKFNMAEKYLARADQYAVTYSRYIRSDSNYRAVFSELFFMRNADCDQLLEEKRYAEALNCYQQFENAYSARDLARVKSVLDDKKSIAAAGLGNLSTMLSEDALKRKDADTALYYYDKAIALRKESNVRPESDIRLDSLAPVMARIKITRISREGAIALEKRQFTLSVTRYKEAKALAADYQVVPGREFDSSFRQAMKNYLIIQLSASQKKIWLNQFDSAQMALERAKAGGFDFGLLQEPDFEAAMDHFKTKIMEQQCRNLRDSFDLRMIRADRNIALLNFINALAYLREAQTFLQAMPGCGIVEIGVSDSISKYAIPADYQHKIRDAGTHTATGNYREAIVELDESQRLFRMHDLNRFGLKMEDLYDFIRGRNNPYLSGKAIVYCLESGKAEDALKYLRLAHDQGLPSVSCYEVQGLLGAQFAAVDYRKSPVADPLKSVAGYVPEEKWYDTFRKSYLQKWSALDKK